MNDKLQITRCPTCGSEKIKRVVRDVTRKYKKQTYTVPAVGVYECPNCGEKIQAYSPAYRKAEILVET